MKKTKENFGTRLDINKVLLLLIGIAFLLALGLAVQNDRYERQYRQVELAVDVNETEYIIGTTGYERMDFYRRLKEIGVTSIAVWDVNLEFPWLLELVDELGFNLVPHPTNIGVTSALETKERLELFHAPRVSTYMFQGPEVTGYPDNLDITAALLQEQGLVVAMDKYSWRQAGMAHLLEQTGYRSVMALTNWPSVSAEAIAASVWEGRIRLLDVKFDLDQYHLEAEVEAKIIPVVSELEKRGYTMGPAQPIPMTNTHPAALVLLVIGGLIAPGLLLAGLLLPVSSRTLTVGLVLGGLAAAGILTVLEINWAARKAAWAASLIFPVLAIVSQQLNLKTFKQLEDEDSAGKRVRLVAAILIKTVLISAVGGTIVYGFTSGPYFLSGLAVYQGVKLAHLLPLPVIFYQALLVANYREEKWRLTVLPSRVAELVKSLFAKKYLIRNLSFIGVAALVGVYYLGRTGHTAGMPVLELELKLRSLLQEALWVRPRFKEYLIGHPALMLALALLAWGRVKAREGYSLLFAGVITAGAVGQISIINSFSHWSTPFSISLIRTLNGLWLGLLTGILLVIACYFLINRLERLGQRK